MAKRLFVGGLPYSTKDEELKTLFAQVGEVVSVAVIIDKFTGQGKGFAFVEMKTEEEAQKAITTLSGTDMGGRKIIVAEARPMEERTPDRGRSYDQRDGGGRSDRRNFNGPKRW